MAPLRRSNSHFIFDSWRVSNVYFAMTCWLIYRIVLCSEVRHPHLCYWYWIIVFELHASSWYCATKSRKIVYALLINNVNRNYQTSLMICTQVCHIVCWFCSRGMYYTFSYAAKYGVLLMRTQLMEQSPPSLFHYMHWCKQAYKIHLKLGHTFFPDMTQVALNLWLSDCRLIAVCFFSSINWYVLYC